MAFKTKILSRNEKNNYTENKQESIDTNELVDKSTNSSIFYHNKKFIYIGLATILCIMLLLKIFNRNHLNNQEVTFDQDAVKVSYEREIKPVNTNTAVNEINLANHSASEDLEEFSFQTDVVDVFKYSYFPELGEIPTEFNGGFGAGITKNEATTNTNNVDPNIPATLTQVKPPVINKTNNVAQSKKIMQSNTIQKVNKEIVKNPAKLNDKVTQKNNLLTKPQNINKKKEVKVEKVTSSSVAIKNSTVKTLTVHQGESLMQVFRNNKLNISEVNAMDKITNGKVLNSFKNGDQIKIKTDGNNRVLEMNLNNGSKFIRQQNGSYKYIK